MKNLTPRDALAACDAITSHVTASPNPFNLSTSDLAAIASAHDVLGAAFSAQVKGALDQKARTDAKDAALAAAGLVLSAAARTALASSATASQLSEIGMARPAKPTRPTAIPAPAGLLVTAQGETRAKLAFDRNGAAYGATYEVFWSPDGFAYQMVATTTKASVLVDQAPGVVAWYKVRAVRAGLVSEFSNTASIYAPSDLARPALRVA